MKRIGIGIGLGVLTAGLCFLLAHGLLQGGKAYFWGPEVEQENLPLAAFLRPALLGFLISLLFSIGSAASGLSGKPQLVITYAAIAVLVLILPAIAVFCRISDGMLWWYIGGLLVAASLMWHVILQRRAARKPQRPAG